MKNPFPPPNMEMIMEQVVKLQMRPLLEFIFSYNQFKFKKEDAYKSTLITNQDTLTYERMPSVLSIISTTFKGSMKIICNDLIGKITHVYLDDLIICSKGLSITSIFQKLWLVPFKISFFLGTSSYILKYLQEQLFSYNTNDSHLKHYLDPT
jgi:hypothetical protein